MSFYMRYELARLIREDEAKTFAGVQRDTGRKVFLHMISDTAAQLESSGLAELIRGAERSGVILESGDFAGTRYLVTAPIEPFNGLRAWLSSQGAGPVQAPMKAPAT